jgi:hypothetical protein
MRSGCARLARTTVLASLTLGALACYAQSNTTVNLNGITRTSNGSGGWNYDTWKPIRASSPGWVHQTADGYLIDPVNDQQTGQYDSDFAGSTTAPSFFIQTGLINNVEVIAMRVIFNTYDPNIISGKFSGNPVNVRIGIDATGDGALDLYMGPNFQGTPGLVFQQPGTGLNTSPSTTSTGTIFHPGGSPALSANNFNYVELNSANASTYYPGWTTLPDGGKTVSEGMMSWAMPVADINAALATALAAVGKPAVTISPSTFLLWVAFTATQNNSVNQDAYGMTAADNQGILWSQFVDRMNAYGSPVPEPSSYGLFLGLGLTAGAFFRRRRAPRAAS